MADEDVKGTSADADVPGEDENVTEPTEVEETPGEDTSAAAEAPEEPAEAGTAAEAEEAGTSAEAEVPGAEAPAPRAKRKRLPRRLRPQKTRPKPRRAASGERKPIVRLEKPAPARGRRQERQGTVVSDAMEKTIVVEVAVVKAHPRYKKVVRRSVKFHAHDERGEAKVGDVVRIVETRPLSKTKRWRLVEVLEVAK
jgi:small subunit ribosomal protein S17